MSHVQGALHTKRFETPLALDMSSIDVTLIYWCVLDRITVLLVAAWSKTTEVAASLLAHTRRKATPGRT